MQRSQGSTTTDGDTVTLGKPSTPTRALRETPTQGGGCLLQSTPPVTLGKQNCYRRKLAVFDGAAGQGLAGSSTPTPWRVTPSERTPSDPCKGDSLFRHLSSLRRAS